MKVRKRILKLSALLNGKDQKADKIKINNIMFKQRKHNNICKSKCNKKAVIH